MKVGQCVELAKKKGRKKRKKKGKKRKEKKGKKRKEMNSEFANLGKGILLYRAIIVSFLLKEIVVRFL